MFLEPKKANLLSIFACFLALSAGCQKNRTTPEDRAPSFNLLLDGEPVPPTEVVLNLKRSEPNQTDAQFSITDIGEEVSQIKKTLMCDKYEIINETTPFKEETSKFALVPEKYPAIAELPRNTACQLTIILSNSKGSTYRKRIRVRLLFDSPMPYQLSFPIATARHFLSHVPHLPVEFLLDDFIISNPTRFPMKFSYQNQMVISAIPIFGFDNDPDRKVWIQWRRPFSPAIAQITRFTADSIALETPKPDDISFQVSPGETRHFQVWGQFPAGSCAKNLVINHPPTDRVYYKRFYAGVRMNFSMSGEPIRVWDDFSIPEVTPLPVPPKVIPLVREESRGSFNFSEVGTPDQPIVEDYWNTGPRRSNIPAPFEIGNEIVGLPPLDGCEGVLPTESF